MVVLNDFGLLLEIFGFIIFLFVPITETWNVKLEQSKENMIKKFIDKHHKIRYGSRYGGIGLIVSSLIMQFSFLNIGI